MSARTVLYVLLAVVAGCAAVLSFAALRDLALECGFARWSAPLLPLVVDAGAAAGTLAWLTPDGRARGFGRALALVLLTASVAGNAVGHALAAYAAAPPWPLVVAVSGVAPAVLGAVVHLAVVAAQAATAPAVLPAEPSGEHTEGEDTRDEHGLSRFWAPELSAPADTVPVDVSAPVTSGGGDAADGPAPATPEGGTAPSAERLIAAGAGRRRLSRELGISEHAARELLAAARNGAGVAR